MASNTECQQSDGQKRYKPVSLALDLEGTMTFRVSFSAARDNRSSIFLEMLVLRNKHSFPLQLSIIQIYSTNFPLRL